MKIQHLRYFTAVVDHGGVVRASERLHITQPSVSAGLKALEQDLGCSLFERDMGRLRLTHAGQRFYRRAAEILNKCDAAKAEVLGTDNRPTVRVGLLSTLPNRLAASLAGEIILQAPETKVMFRVGTAARIAAWFKQGRIDAALTVHDESHLADRAQIIHREPFVCLTTEPLPFSGEKSIRLQNLAREPFVSRTQCERHQMAQAVFRAEGVTLNVVAVAENDGSALALVRHGIGTTLAPRSLQEEGLCAIEVENLHLERALGLFWRHAVSERLIGVIEEVAVATFV